MVDSIDPNDKLVNGLTERLTKQLQEQQESITDPILQFFNYTHLPDKLQEVSRPFHAMAWHIFRTIPRNPERTVALRKLLESKDAAVRAIVYNLNS